MKFSILKIVDFSDMKVKAIKHGDLVILSVQRGFPNLFVQRNICSGKAAFQICSYIWLP